MLFVYDTLLFQDGYRVEHSCKFLNISFEYSTKYIYITGFVTFLSQVHTDSEFKFPLRQNSVADDSATARMIWRYNNAREVSK